MGVNFLGATRIYGKTDVELFEVSTAIGPVYVRHHSGEDQRKVLVVDAQKFLKLWRNITYQLIKQSRAEFLKLAEMIISFMRAFGLKSS